MSDVDVVDALRRETRRYLLPFLFDLDLEWEKSFDIGGGNIVAVGPLNQRLPFQIEDRYKTRHREDDGQQFQRNDSSRNLKLSCMALRSALSEIYSPLVMRMAPESCLGQAQIWKFFQILDSREPNP